MKRFKPTNWPRAIVNPISSMLSQAIGGLSGKDRRKVQLLRAALEIAEAECARLHQEMQELLQYTDGELQKAKQETERIIQERDELQLQVLILEEDLSALAAQSSLEPSTSLDSTHQGVIIEPRQNDGASSEAISSFQSGDSSIPPSSLDLSDFRLALVGGHPSTRRGVIQELQAHYGLKHFVEIPRMNEANTTRNRVKSKIYRCNLVVLITGYMSHRLTEIVFSLKDAGALAGEVLQLNCKGKSGVLRGILNHVESGKAF
ncbi:MAG: hypothetical protein AAGD25_00795 [Cyanobacteria bacterium P01_F01_bin.150]